MAGRKTKLTPQLIKNAERLLKGGNYVNTVCEYLGIGESTWYRWMEEGEQAQTGLKREFWESIKKAEAEAEIRLITDLQKIADEDRSWQAIAWMLERKYPSRWGKKDRLTAEIEHSGQITNKEETHVTIKQQITADAESRELLKQLWRRRVAIQGEEK
jgi:transposase